MRTTAEHGGQADATSLQVAMHAPCPGESRAGCSARTARRPARHRSCVYRTAATPSDHVDPPRGADDDPVPVVALRPFAAAVSACITRTGWRGNRTTPTGSSHGWTSPASGTDERRRADDPRALRVPGPGTAIRQRPTRAGRPRHRRRAPRGDHLRRGDRRFAPARDPRPRSGSWTCILSRCMKYRTWGDRGFGAEG